MDNKYDLELYNCGGFALNKREWITPYIPLYKSKKEDTNTLYTDAERESVIMTMVASGIPAKELIALLLQFDTDFLLQQYPQLTEIKLADAKQSDRVIAYRLTTPNVDDPDFEAEDIDFHFRVRINGFWFEKIGSLGIRLCDYSEEPWQVAADLIYDSNIKYFILQE